MLRKVWGEITYPFLNPNIGTDKFGEWMSNYLFFHFFFKSTKLFLQKLECAW